ncbi:nickel transporter, partial [Bordetella petrii]|nr:nickel transporter [Bordetella petrii]
RLSTAWAARLRRLVEGGAALCILLLGLALLGGQLAAGA